MAKRYSEEQKETALILAASKGNRPAEADTGIPETTIRRWIQEDPERWAEIRAAEAPKWRARAAVAAEDLAEYNYRIALEALQKAEQDLAAGKLEPKDYINLAKVTAINMGIGIDKANTLRGMPTEIHEHRYDLAQIERAIKATERVIDAEVVDMPELEAGTQG